MTSYKAAGLGLAWILLTSLNIALLPGRYATPVPVEMVRKTALPQVVRASGTVEPKRSVVLKAEFEGPVVSKLYKEGDAVRKGQLVMVIGRDKIRLEHENKAIALENAKTDLIKTRKDVKVEKALFKKGAVAQSSVEDAERAVVRAAQAVKTAEEDFRLQQDKWNKNKIFATFDGTLLKDSLGDEPMVTAGKEIVTLADMSEYSVVVKVDELEIGQIRPLQKAEVRLQAYPGVTIPAQVKDIGSQAEANGLTEVPVTLTLDKVPGIRLRPKMTAIVSIVTGQLGRVVSVPLTAISNATGETRVWVIDASGRLRSRKVVLGQSNPDRAEISQGLAEGERICAMSDPRLAEGMKVKIAKTAEVAPSSAVKTMSKEDVLKQLRQMPGGAPPPEILERIQRMRETHKRKDE